jgi:hypothetical protein
MDGVLADFNKAYTKIATTLEDPKRFRTAVLDYHIFEDLEFMPDTHQLLNHVKKIDGINIEILTSMGTYNPEQGIAAKTQKLKWLERHNIGYKANFVRTKTEKAEYANEYSILIDDSVGCVSPFIRKGGHGILHTNASETISILDATIAHVSAVKALRS